MLLGLVGLGVLDKSFDRQRELLSQRLSAERNNIEPVTSLRRDTRKTYVALLERWLQPPGQWPDLESALQAQTTTLLLSSRDFLQGTALTTAEHRNRTALAADLADWVAFVGRIIGSAAGPEVRAEARERLAEIDRRCAAILTANVDAAKQDDAAREALNRKDGWGHVAIVVLLALLLIYLLVWYLHNLTTRRVTEAVRRQQQQKEQSGMLECMVRERTAELEASHQELSQTISRLRESERRFQTTFEQAAVGMAIVGPDGKLLQVNRRLCEIVGYTGDELVRLRVQDITHPEDLPPDLEAFRALRSGQVATHSRCKRYLRKDGEIVWIKLAVAAVRDEAGPLDYLVAAYEDITQAKRAELALQESEEKFRRLFDCAHDAIMTLEPPTWRFTDANPATLAMFNAKSVAEFTAYGLCDLSPEKQADGRASDDAALALIGTAMREGSAYFEWTHKRIDGQEFPVTVLLTRMPRAGQPFLQATVRDISKQKQLEIELGHAHKLEAVGQLAAGIAHEINTPAQFVGDGVHFLKEAFEGYRRLVRPYRRAVDVLATGGGQEALLSEIRAIEEEIDLSYLDANVPGSFESCQDGISRITTIVRAMKEFAHPDQREKASADLNQALLTTLAVAKSEYKYVADVVTQLGDLPPVLCHVGDLNQVFLNLIVNAAHAIGDVVGQSGTRGAIRITTLQEGDLARIDIADTGSGIPEAIRHRIFDPFFTTKGVGKGTGQGLSIARSIVVTKHRGSLTVESEVGKGSTFTIRLPIEEGPDSVGHDHVNGEQST
jgi:PAS domain S-box-containing protein